jgi:hypothetical protein
MDAPGLLKKGRQHLPFLRFLTQECGLKLAELEGPDVAICTYVATSGSGELMQFVREQGCKWDQRVLTVAACYNRIPLMRWIKQQEPAWSWPKDLISQAIAAGAGEAAEYVKEQLALEAAKPVAASGSKKDKDGHDDEDVDDRAPQGPPAAKRAKIDEEPGAGAGDKAPGSREGYRY